MQRIKAPKQLDFSPHDCDDFIIFLKRILKANDNHVVLDVSKTISISEGGFLTLKAQVEKAAHATSKRFIISKPKSKKVLEFLKAQFMSQGDTQKVEFHVSMAENKDVSMNTLTDPAIIDRIVLGLKKIGIKEYFDPFYDFLVELIGNATEHGIKNRNLNWWLIHYRDNQNKSLRYVFVDMGTGIAGSHRKAGLPFSFWLSTDKRIISAALKGELGSSTKQENRGNGLPFIKEIVEKGYLSDFLLVSNRVKVCSIDGKLVYSQNANFVGTYYSWSISKENVNIWMNSKL